MNSQLLQHIYQTYQPNEYYRRYLKQSKHRPDSRLSHQHRTLRIGINPLNSSVTVSRGNCIVVVGIETNISEVVYSPVTESYGKRLIDLQVCTSHKLSKTSKNSCKAIESFVDSFLNWKSIEAQLVYRNEQKSTSYGHVGKIFIRIADNDGCVLQTALIAVQILLWTWRVKNIKSIMNATDKGNHKIGIESEKDWDYLKLGEFWFPIKYCEILNELLIDPTAQEQEASSYELTLLSNTRQTKKETPYRIVKVHKTGTLAQQTLKAIEDLYESEIKKIGIDVQKIRQSLSNDTCNIVIEGI